MSKEGKGREGKGRQIPTCLGDVESVTCKAPLAPSLLDRALAE